MWFYDKEVYTTIKTKVNNNVGQLVENYEKDKLFLADVQPLTKSKLIKEWGEDLKSTKEIYADIKCKVGDILIYNNEAYEIEARVEWDDYSIYAVKEVDVEWQN